MKEENIETIGKAVAKLIGEMKELQIKVDSLTKTLSVMVGKQKEEKTFRATFTGFENFEDFDKFMNICSNIAVRDETFNYEINRTANEISIFTKGQNEIHKKAMWLISKTGIRKNNLKYKVT